LISGIERILFSFPQPLSSSRAHPAFYEDDTVKLFPTGRAEFKQRTHLHLVSRLKTHGGINPLPSVLTGVVLN
jgi:hypothetical protein